MTKCRTRKHVFTKFRLNIKKVQICLYCGKTRKELNLTYGQELYQALKKISFKDKLSQLYKKELMERIDRVKPNNRI